MIKIVQKIINKQEVLFVSIIYICFTLFVILTKPMTGIKMDVFIYPAYLSFLLGPSYLIYIKKHTSYVTNTYCNIRIGSKYKAYILRMRYLIVETAFFIAPFCIILMVSNYMLNSPIKFYLFFIIYLHFIFTFFQIGVIVTSINLKWSNSYFASLLMMLVLVFDYFLSLNYFVFEFNIFVTPLLSIFTQDTFLNEVQYLVIMFIRCVVFFLIGALIFYGNTDKKQI